MKHVIEVFLVCVQLLELLMAITLIHIVLMAGSAAGARMKDLEQINDDDADDDADDDDDDDEPPVHLPRPTRTLPEFWNITFQFELEDQNMFQNRFQNPEQGERLSGANSKFATLH